MLTIVFSSFYVTWMINSVYNFNFSRHFATIVFSMTSKSDESLSSYPSPRVFLSGTSLMDHLVLLLLLVCFSVEQV